MTKEQGRLGDEALGTPTSCYGLRQSSVGVRVKMQKPTRQGFGRSEELENTLGEKQGGTQIFRRGRETSSEKHEVREMGKAEIPGLRGKPLGISTVHFSSYLGKHARKHFGFVLSAKGFLCPGLNIPAEGPTQTNGAWSESTLTRTHVAHLAHPPPCPKPSHPHALA